MAVFQALKDLFVPVGFRVSEAVVPAAPTTYSIRPLTDKNLRELIRLNLRCFENGENYTKHTFSYLLNDPRTLAYRAVTAKDNMAGYIFALTNSDGVVHITTVGVAPEHRRRGVGEMLLDHTEEMLCQKGLTTIILEVRISNVAAQCLYRKAGYTSVQRLKKYYSNGEDGLLMTKSLI